jgi:hypothetical protein
MPGANGHNASAETRGNTTIHQHQPLRLSAAATGTLPGNGPPVAAQQPTIPQLMDEENYLEGLDVDDLFDP